MSESNDNPNSVEMAAELTIAWLANHNTRASGDDVVTFLNRMKEAVDGFDVAPPAEVEVPAFRPAVTVRKSLASNEHIVSMIDGKPYRTLRRHLSTHGLTPDDYRRRYGLAADYPIVAPAYSEQRRAMAKSIGLGTKANGGRGR